MLLYTYDLKIKGLNSYNTLKRRFYYDLGKSELSASPWRTKSVLLVSEGLEEKADVFFRRFEGFIEVYKVRFDELVKVV
ncbi:hypothetical protein HY992_00925 [Candidatus Micrarchaeota archaeon]|nr:hypothetical protein [Candidatus Micrarchaeota archaeon]